LPWAKLYWPFRPEKNSYNDWCVKISLMDGVIEEKQFAELMLNTETIKNN
jgi:hypothetical protein